jgi:hypothetical protein
MTIQNQNGGDTDQTPLSPADLMRKLEEIESEAEGGTGEGQTDDSNMTDDDKRRRDHAFAEQRRLMQAAKKRIKELEAQSQTPAQPPAQPPVQPAPAMDGRMQGRLLMLQLQNEAMTNLGIADPKEPLVQMEVQRLYNERINAAQTRAESVRNAPALIESVLGQFAILDDQDRVEIRKRIAGLDASLQGNEKALKSVVQIYIGENFDVIKARTSNGQGGGSSGTGGDAGAAAGSQVRTRGSGVPPANRGGQDVKPATSDEMRKMRQLGLDPMKPKDVQVYRQAAERKAVYDHQ